MTLMFGSVLFPVLCETSSSNFIFNGFDSDEARTKITCYQSASFKGNNLQLTAIGAVQASGRCLYNIPIQLLDPQTRAPLSFSTQFIFYIQPSTTSDLADGISFIFAPSLSGVPGSNQGYMGIYNDTTNGKSSTHTFAIEFDTYKNPEFEDIDANHIGIDVNDIVSWAVTSAALRTSSSPILRNAEDGYAVQMTKANVQAWIDYDALTNQLNISVSRNLGVKPIYALISNSSLNLSSLFNENMYVGFTASTGPLPTVLYHIYAWSFSSNGGLAMNISTLRGKSDSSRSKKCIIIGVVFGTVGFLSITIVLLYVYHMKFFNHKNIGKDELPLSLREYLPQEYSYRELAKATGNFSEKNRLGSGGFGEVFQGTIASTGVAIAVKRISQESKQGVKEFASEVATLGRIRHRNLVPLLGWSQERGLMLVYQLMPHGSLDQVLFSHPEKLPWNQRLNILRGVASALLYLHEEYEQKIVHRDVKASNVMLDAQMNGRLGDFGLARLYGHDVAPGTTNVAGTWGYMAPESFFTRKATEQTDVFSFGALTLEVATGKKMSYINEKEGCSMIEWLWNLQKSNTLQEAVDPVLVTDGEPCDMVKLVLELGLLCCYPDPQCRPSMRRVVQVLSGDSELPTVPPAMVSPFLFSSLALSSSVKDLSTSQSDDMSFLTTRKWSSVS
ncbi:hypothetical protein KP509_19G053900 [Ceratopteris richardii]|nr:hypothetical protein KP509_19G053900 [Ceratopteris richardii]